jgi:hypothetical protein
MNVEKRTASQIGETLAWLQAQGLPALPIAPRQPAEQYPQRDRRTGEPKRDRSGHLVPQFSGKNPSYLDASGQPHLVQHSRYRDRLPSAAELQTWFANPANGIGTLGGIQGLIWIDIDVKHFDSLEECDRQVENWIAEHPQLQETWIERTHSGGWRLGVTVAEPPTFTNISLEPGGPHIGEALGTGRLTVLAPTIGPSGQPYRIVQRVPPVPVASLASIGLHPHSRRQQRSQPVPPPRRLQIVERPAAIAGSVDLGALATPRVQSILQGEDPYEDRSAALTVAARELYGWENWTAAQGIAIAPPAPTLLAQAGEQLGIDAERVTRILSTINPSDCVPAATYAGDELSAWKRLRSVAREAYEQHCPPAVQAQLNPAAPKPHQQTVSLMRQWYRQAQAWGVSGAQLAEIEHWGKQAIAGRPIPRRVLGRVRQDLERYTGLAKQGIQAARYLLDRVGWPQENGRVFAGWQYRIEAQGERLTVEARDRGLLLAAQGQEAQVIRLTAQDVARIESALHLARDPPEPERDRA